MKGESGSRALGLERKEEREIGIETKARETKSATKRRAENEEEIGHGSTRLGGIWIWKEEESLAGAFLKRGSNVRNETDSFPKIFHPPFFLFAFLLGLFFQFLIFSSRVKKKRNTNGWRKR